MHRGESRKDVLNYVFKIVTRHVKNRHSDKLQAAVVMDADTYRKLGKNNIVELKAKGILSFQTVRYCTSIFQLLDQKTLFPEHSKNFKELKGKVSWTKSDERLSDGQRSLQCISEAWNSLPYEQTFSRENILMAASQSLLLPAEEMFSKLLAYADESRERSRRRHRRQLYSLHGAQDQKKSAEEKFFELTMTAELEQLLNLWLAPLFSRFNASRYSSLLYTLDTFIPSLPGQLWLM